ELLKTTGEESVTVLTDLCNKIWVSGKWPNDWIKSTYIPIPKKGDSRDCNNYRTISLISHASKILLKVKLYRPDWNHMSMLSCQINRHAFGREEALKIR